MANGIVSDTSCLMILSNIHEIELLYKVFGPVLTTPYVADEFGEELPDWIEIRSPKDQKVMKRLELVVDLGEAVADRLRLCSKYNVKIIYIIAYCNVLLA